MEIQFISKQYYRDNWLRLLIASIIAFFVVLFLDFTLFLIFPLIFSIFFVSKSDDLLETVFNFYIVSQFVLFLLIVITWFYNIKVTVTEVSFHLLYDFGVYGHVFERNITVYPFIVNGFVLGFSISFISPVITMLIHKRIRKLLIKLNIVKSEIDDTYYEKHDIFKAVNKEMT